MRRNNHRSYLISIILFILFAIGIGYAYLTSNLSISGTTGIVGNSWDIHFENLNVKDGSVTATSPATISNSTTDITYSIRLERPKDYYEFTVDVKNDGTLPGKVSISSLAGITTEAAPIIDYTIAYTNGNSVNIGDILNAGAKKTIKVRVFYKDEIDPEDFPANDLNLTLTYTLQYIQSEEDEFDTNALIEQLKEENSSCMYQYTGAVTDEVGVTKTNAENVYYNRCADKRNIKFAGYCWQMIRTTETGGIKMIYNGEPDQNEECSSTRGTHKGFVGTQWLTQNLASEYLYGTTFTYNTTTSEFTLVDTMSAIWSDSTYENLLGKFTCKNANGTCTTLYNVNGYSNSTTAYTSSYTIGDTNYAQIGTSSYNANPYSPAMVGYMFNKVYYPKLKSISETNKFGSEFTYVNGIYTLSGTTQDLTTLKEANINNTHYTCWNAGGTCTNIFYIYQSYNQTGFYRHYIEISDGKSVTDATNEMLYDDDVNTYNSTIKGIVDSWYAQNLSSKTNMLEDTVYCNARNMSNQSTNGWNPNGGDLSINIKFKNANDSKDISCANETDQFAVSNNKAKLTYPVGLATGEELYTLTKNNSTTYYSTLTNTGNNWWTFSPSIFGGDGSYVTNMYIAGSVGGWNPVYLDYGVRLVITLSPGTVITDGTGSEVEPWIVEE